ncbi:MAG: hypothetical protein IPN74_16870 [Haliscomenobacter sp.]|nr:hypothetical protein [Haliscomenobacter sp.]
METQGAAVGSSRRRGLLRVRCSACPSDPENATVGHQMLEQQDWRTGTDYLIHLTGGTKMMALAAFAFFAGKPGSKLVYLPLNAPHFLELHPEPQEIPVCSVNLEEYFRAYGVVRQSFKTDWMDWVSKADETMLAVLGDTASERGSQILEWVARKGSWDNLPSAEKNFYSGEWFEVWLAGQIQRIFKLPEDCICVGAKLNR